VFTDPYQRPANLVEADRESYVSGRCCVVDRIEVRHSDVFSNVDGAFDLIIFDPRFRGYAPVICWKLPSPTTTTGP
jgi:hypothetical protein